MSNISFECDDDGDCSVEGLFGSCFEENDFSDKVNFCDCSSWHGWKGEDCTEPSATVYYSRTMGCVFSFWALFVMLTTGKTLYIYFNHVGRTRIKDVNPVAFVA